MKNFSRFIRFVASIILSLTFAQTAQAGDVKVYAAASMTDALIELEKLYRPSQPGVSVKFSFAGSSALAKQIENGAPADIFISADMEWAEYLQTRQLLDKKNSLVLISNELVLISSLAATVDIELDKSFDLPGKISGKLCTGDPEYVPVGKYAKEALTYYGWWEAIQPKLVGTENVRVALAFVERGECALGIVYKSDALISNKVKILGTFSSESHALIQYPAGLISTENSEANDFWRYLQSDDARAVFTRYGFTASEKHKH